MNGALLEHTLPYACARKRARADANAKMNEQTQTEIVMKRAQLKNLLRLAALLALGAAGPAAANSGLRTQFGEVVVRNLKIGQTYSLQKMLNLPYRVVNTGDQQVELKVDLIQLATGDLKDGYEPLPDLSWVRLSTQDFTVDPSQEVASDVIVSIPDDPKYMGRRYEADIWAHTIDRTTIVAVGMMSKLLIAVSSQRATQDELKYKPSERQLANLDFTLFPAIGKASDVPVGRVVDLTKDYKASIKIVNPNDQAMRFKIVSEPNWETLLTRPRDFEDAWDPKWLTPAEDVVEVPGNSIKDVALSLHLPQGDSYYGRHFFFPVSVTPLGQDIPTKVFYKLLVGIQDKPAAPGAPKK